MVHDITGCMVVNDVEALDRAMNGKQRKPILFTENERAIRIWPREQRKEPMGIGAGLLGWCRDLVVVFQGAMTRYEGQTANVV